MNKGIVVLIIVIVLAAAGGVWALTKKSSSPTTSTTTPTASSSTNTASPAQSANTITYTDNGFSPATLTVKAGTTVTIKNASSSVLQFDSNPHPVHTDDPELNVGVIAPGQSKTVTVTTTGTHGYHNHNNTSDTGTLIVQ